MPTRLCVLHNFDNQCRGSFPNGNCRPLVQDGPTAKVGAIVQGPNGDDNFYGTTPNGGKYNAGTIYSITPAGDVTVLYNFGDGGMTDGGYPSGGVTLGADGYLYGTTYVGGNDNVGTIYRMARAIGKPEILYSFRGGIQDRPERGKPAPPPLTPEQIDDLSPGYPTSAPILGHDGNIYGVTPTSNPAAGALYRLSPGHVLKCLHRFKNTEAATYGLFPTTLTLGLDGSFYGTTRGDDHGRWETVFRFNPSTTSGITMVYKFKPGDGSFPNGVIQGVDSNLYGTTYSGGPYYRGVVFRLTLDGQYKILHAFDGNVSNPVASVVEVLQHNMIPPDSASQTKTYYLYGASEMNHSLTSDGPTGILFRVNTDGLDFSTVFNFDGRSGTGPQVTPVLARESTPGGPNLYGIAEGGGTSSAGVFYWLNTAYFVTGTPEIDSTTIPTNPHQKLVLQGNRDDLSKVTDNLFIQVWTHMAGFQPWNKKASRDKTSDGITVRVRNSDARIVQFFYRQRFNAADKGRPAAGWVEEYDPHHVYGVGETARSHDAYWISTKPGNNQPPPSDPGCEKLATGCGGYWTPAYWDKDKTGVFGNCQPSDHCISIPACDKNDPYKTGSFECYQLTTNPYSPIWYVDAQGREADWNGRMDPYYLPIDTTVDCDGYTLFDSPTVRATPDEDWKFTAVDYVIMHRYVVATVTWIAERQPKATQTLYSVSIKGAPGPEACAFKKLLDKYNFEQPFDLPFTCPK